MKEQLKECPLCGKDCYISVKNKSNFACSDVDCLFSIGSIPFYKMMDSIIEDFIDHEDILCSVNCEIISSDIFEEEEEEEEEDFDWGHLFD